MSEIYLALITQNEVQNLSSMLEVSHYFTGLAAVDHFSTDGSFEVMDAVKGKGFVVRQEFYNHHSFAMNGFLLNPKLPIGSWVLLRDSLERCNPEFAARLPDFIQKLEDSGINSVYQYSKLLLFKKFEHQIFLNSPHWALQGAQPKSISIETIPGFEDPKTYCYSVRNDIRPKDHAIDHFMKYYLYDSSNHLALDHKDTTEFLQHEEFRQEFKVRMRRIYPSGPLTVAQIKTYCKGQNPITDQFFKVLVNTERLVADFYRYHVLKHELDDIKATPNWKCP